MHRHGYKGRKFSLKKQPRELMLRNLATSVILHEKVKTTLEKAKEVQPMVERMISIAKKESLSGDRMMHAYLLDEQAVYKLQTELAKLYKEREGGYTRITKIGFRSGDSAKMAMIELIDVEKLDKAQAKKESENKETETKKEVKTAVKKTVKGKK